MPTPFSQILDGSAPASIVYEDGLAIVILDHDPISPGHMLIIPRESIADLTDLPAELSSHLMLLTQQMMSLLRRAYDYSGVTVWHNYGTAQDIPHVHIHVFGRDPSRDISLSYPSYSSTEISPSVVLGRLQGHL